MSSATLTSPPAAAARLVVDTDVASFVFKWHPEFAPRYVGIIRGAQLVVSFMTRAEMRQWALDAHWGPRKCESLKPIWATSPCSTQIAFCVLLGLRCGARAYARDAKSAPLTRGSRPLRWFCQRPWLLTTRKTTAASTGSSFFPRPPDSRDGALIRFLVLIPAVVHLERPVHLGVHANPFAFAVLVHIGDKRIGRIVLLAAAHREV